jgi:type IV pilus assembly protein PilY1
VLYIGGNDGMLHAFRDGQAASDPLDGREIFAYVPRFAIDSLAVLADKSYGQSTKYHQYFVDGPMREADVHVPAPGGSKAEWRNYLLGSAGAGGRSVFALDITDPGQLGVASVRWELGGQQDPDLGYIRFPIQAGQLPNGKWVALFGNGSGSAAGSAVLYVVDVDTGLARRVKVPSATGSGLGGVGLVRDIRGQVVAAYAGDLEGNLYRFEYSAAAASTGFLQLANGGRAVFSAPAGQPIVQAPLVFAHSLGGNLVMVGTGQLLSAADATDRRVQAIYAVRDTLGTSTPARSKAELAERQLAFVPSTDAQSSVRYVSVSGAQVDWKTQQGWFAPLALTGYDGLRVAYPMQVLKGAVAFIGAIAPGQNVASCESSDGKAVNLLLPAETGSTPARPFFDTNADGVFDSQDAAYVGYATAADGADAVLEFTSATRASCTMFSLQNTSGQVSACVGSAPSSAGTLAVRDRVWRRLLNPPF